ncbi:MAG: S-methyl-5-thioribose-1-phosphate isomerase, partial [Promethearchaeota archaeon]
MEEAAEIIRSTRPTASNLFWAVNRIWKIISEYPDNPSGISELVIEEAKLMAQEDIIVNKSIGKN